eukprot:12658127-Ditylum_brightwellii.AAC.1
MRTFDQLPTMEDSVTNGSNSLSYCWSVVEVDMGILRDRSNEVGGSGRMLAADGIGNHPPQIN